MLGDRPSNASQPAPNTGEFGGLSCSTAPEEVVRWSVIVCRVSG